VRDRGILRARIFLGGVVLLAAFITWATAFMMSPHGDLAATDLAATGAKHVRPTVVLFMRNSAVGALVLCAIAAWLLFPARRPRRPARDWTIIGLISLMVLTSLYQLVWVSTLGH
jgi:hypothetical protein